MGTFQSLSPCIFPRKTCVFFGANGQNGADVLSISVIRIAKVMNNIEKHERKGRFIFSHGKKSPPIVVAVNVTFANRSSRIGLPLGEGVRGVNNS